MLLDYSTTQLLYVVRKYSSNTTYYAYYGLDANGNTMLGFTSEFCGVCMASPPLSPSSPRRPGGGRSSSFALPP